MAASASSRDFCGVDTAAAFFSLVQAVLWFVLSIFALLVAGCTFISDTTSAAYIIVFVYFYNSECKGDVDWLPGDWDPSTTRRTRVVAWYFLATSALRVAAAGALLVMLGLRTRRCAADRTAAAFWAWAALSAACLLGDLACAIVYAVDMGRAESLAELMDVPAELSDAKLYWSLRVVPFVMVIFCFRWGILWIVEATMLGTCIRVRMKEKREMVRELPRNHWPPSPTITSMPSPRVLAEGGADSVGASGVGGGAGHYRDSWQGNTAAEQQSSHYLPRIADIPQWGGARPKEPSWRDGGGDRLQGASSYEYAAHPQGSRDHNYPAGGGGGADREDRFQSVNRNSAHPPVSRNHNYPGGGGGGGGGGVVGRPQSLDDFSVHQPGSRHHNSYQWGGGGGDRLQGANSYAAHPPGSRDHNYPGGGGGGGGRGAGGGGANARPMRAVLSAPMRLPRADYHAPPERRGEWDPRSPLPLDGGRSPFFPAQPPNAYK